MHEYNENIISYDISFTELRVRPIYYLHRRTQYHFDFTLSPIVKRDYLFHPSTIRKRSDIFLRIAQKACAKLHWAQIIFGKPKMQTILEAASW